MLGFILGRVLSAMEESAKSLLELIWTQRLMEWEISSEEEEYGIQRHLDFWVNCS